MFNTPYLPFNYGKVLCISLRSPSNAQERRGEVGGEP